ncbi:MAG: PBSX family phage terminase large subunit, partial [Candidatus Hadarchaeum sp.]
MKVIVSDSFYPLLEDRSRYLVLCGGAGSGKSEFAAIKLFYRCMKEGNHRFLSLRKVRNRVHQSNVAVMLSLLERNSVPYDFNKSERLLTFYSPEGKKNEILFDGLDDPKKIKSIKGITGMHLEETTEFTREDFLQLDLRLREPGPSYHQIILTFNPDEDAAPWLKDMFFDHKNPDATVHVSTLNDNPIQEVRERYRKQLEELKSQDETMYSIYGLGQWAKPKGRIFSWDVVPLPQDRSDLIPGSRYPFGAHCFHCDGLDRAPPRAGGAQQSGLHGGDGYNDEVVCRGKETALFFEYTDDREPGATYS